MKHATMLKHFFMARSRAEKLNLFLHLACRNSEDSILDVGVADLEYSPIDNFLEKYYHFPEKITALSIFPLDQFRKRYPQIRTVVYEGGRFPFNDDTFNVVHSNAVIEHVGGHDAQVYFVKEMARVGRRIFFTTPARYFPMETHTNIPLLHYLPKEVFDRFLLWVGKGWASGNFMHLLTKRDIETILVEAGVSRYRVLTIRLLGLPLNYIVTAETN